MVIFKHTVRQLTGVAPSQEELQNARTIMQNAIQKVQEGDRIFILLER